MDHNTKFDVEIADASGHSTVQMTQNEIAEKAAQTQGSWVFVNNQLVSAADIADMNLEAGSRIRLMPALDPLEAVADRRRRPARQVLGDLLPLRPDLSVQPEDRQVVLRLPGLHVFVRAAGWHCDALTVVPAQIFGARAGKVSTCATFTGVCGG